jgi:integrase
MEKSRLGLSWNTVRNAWVVLSAILDSAVQCEYLSENPARGVRFPVKPPQKAVRILTPESLWKLLSHLDEPYQTMVVLVILTGLRIGELLALRWRVVDLKAETLYICESVFRSHFQTPKSRCGVRTIPIGPEACRLLESHLQRSLPGLAG